MPTHRIPLLGGSPGPLRWALGVDELLLPSLSLPVPTLPPRHPGPLEEESQQQQERLRKEPQQQQLQNRGVEGRIAGLRRDLATRIAEELPPPSAGSPASTAGA